MAAVRVIPKIIRISVSEVRDEGDHSRGNQDAWPGVSQRGQSGHYLGGAVDMVEGIPLAFFPHTFQRDVALLAGAGSASGNARSCEPVLGTISSFPHLRQ